MTEWNWPGARWWKVDFHTHTPASEDYGKGPHQAELKRRSQREWLLDFMRAEIDCVAVTDHNSGVWIDPLKAALEELREERPEGYRDLVLFPGVEISCSGGVHVLAIFGPASRTSDIDSLLGAVEYRGERGRSNGVTSLSCEQIFQKIADARALAIPAHVDQEAGLFKLSGETLRQALGKAEDCGVVAMEVVEGDSEPPALYRERKLNWARVLGSDSHRPDQVGSRYTWVKMGTDPTLEGLRLALLDGAVRVVRDPVRERVSPNVYDHAVIEELEIRDAKYLGRGEPFRLVFNPWLNAIIGGRGTGKSTTVEFLRLALRREEDLPESLQKDFAKYSMVSAGRGDGRLVTEETRLVVLYRKDGRRFRIHWGAPEAPAAIQVEVAPDDWRDEPGEIRSRFPVRIYSQKQIFELAQSPLALLQQVDQAPEVGKAEWEQGWHVEWTRYLDLCRQERELVDKLLGEERLRGELEDLRHKLQVFEQAGHTEVLRDLHRTRRQRRRIETWEADWSETGARLREMAEEIVPADLTSDTAEAAGLDDAELLGAAQRAAGELQDIRQRLQGLAGKADDAWQGWLVAKQSSRWQAGVDGSEQAYADLSERLKAENVEDPAGYGVLMQQYQVLEGRLQALGQDRGQLQELADGKARRFECLLQLRRDLTLRRRNFLEAVLDGNPYVRIAVLSYWSRETVKAELRDLLDLQNGRFDSDIQALVDGLYPVQEEDPPEVAQLEHRLHELKRTIRGVRRGEKAPLGDGRFKNHLERLSQERLDRLDLWFPEDSLDVGYRSEVRGKHVKEEDFRPIESGSPGQKTAALLAFLLQLGDEPMVLDQPEDDLDNRLIYDLIVTQLRTLKSRRQVIVVTHNANIVVNGDAELVTVLTAGGGRTWCNSRGSLQESSVRDDICQILEGGKEAFEERYRRILHPGFREGD